MATLHVVRHGQASFFEDNYDRLSPLGIEQAQLLGRQWAELGLRFDQVFTGPRQRQRDTAHWVGQEFLARGLPWPEPQIVAGLDEYEAEAVLKQALPGLIERVPEIRTLHAEIAQAGDRQEHLRRFQRLYEVVIRRWAAGEWDLADVESWPAFCERTEAAWQLVTAQGGRQSAAFTSGGPVGVAVVRSLGAPLLRALEVAWMVRNGAVSEFLFSGQRFSLSSFNNLAHLPRGRHWTYR